MRSSRTVFVTRRSTLATEPMLQPLLLLLALLGLFAAVGPSSAASCYRALSRSDFPHCQLLSPSFALHWAVRGDNITLGLDGDTGGYPDSWLAIALSDSGGMKGADFMIVAGPTDNESVDQNGDGDGDEDDVGGANASSTAGGATTPAPIPTPTTSGGWRVIDAHALDFVQPTPDKHQDVTLVSPPLSGPNYTVAVVTRRLRTCDPWDRNIQVGTPQTVSWAMGRHWPSQHTTRGNSMVFFVPEADRLWGVANATTATTAALVNPAAAPTSRPSSGTGQKVGLLGATPPATTSQEAQQFARLFTGIGDQAVEEAEAKAGGGGDVKGEGISEGEDGEEEAEEFQFTDPVLKFEIRMPNITIPDNATTSYLCTHFQMPHDRKYHIVGLHAFVKSLLVHHMILFACEKPPDLQQQPLGAIFSCLSSGGGASCNTFVFGWAPGRTSTEMPPSVGLPIGEADSTTFSFQVHYNNPDGISGVVDDSGFRVYYTAQLRPYDAAILTVGQTAITIPPGQERYTLAPNVCPSTCTSQLPGPLRLLSSGLHMHTLGHTIVTQHIRNGTELPPIGSKMYYDFDFQSFDPVPLDSSLLVPGDVLITTCSYDSTSRTNVTTYGESTDSEMCFNFIMYYPKMRNLTQCASMDAVGDPRVAVCAGAEAFTQMQAVLKELQPEPAVPILTKPPALNLSAQRSLAPFFRSVALVPVPSSDLQYKPYGRECPDMWYKPVAK